MNYPLISEYVEAIKAAEDNFEQLKHLRPVLDDDGNPVMSSGGFAVVFKMKDEQTGKLHAVKCFLKEQEGRAEAYRMIAEELEYVSSTYLTPIKYLDKELFVDTSQSDETEFPVLLMDWVEGVTLDKYIRENIYDEYALSMLAYQFSRLAMWLIPQPFAHGDLKPDNILVRDDGTLVLVDYDGMYVPSMKGQRARELGSPDFRHPSRTETDFDEHIDDFSLATILLSLKAISLQPELLEQYGASDRLLFSEKDYRNVSQCELLKRLYPSADSELNILLCLFTLSLEKQNLSTVSFRLLNINRPEEPEYKNLSTEVTDEDLANAWTDEYGVKYSRDGKKLLDWENFSSKEYFVKPGTIVICNGAFRYCSSLTIIHIPNSITRIGNYSFLGCDSLSEIHISDSVTSIGDSAFANCNSLSEIQIPNSVTRIEDAAFYRCGSLTKIHIPNSVTSIGNSAFSECSSLSEIQIPESVTYIGDGIFLGCSSLKEIHISDSVTSIGKSAFSRCCSLTEIHIPNSVTSIGDRAFLECSSLQEIQIPNSVNSIGDDVFLGCSSLLQINIPSSVNHIGSQVFDNCDSLKYISIPHGSYEKYKELLPEYQDLLLVETLSTEVTEEDLANAWTDEYGAKYSKDRKRLLKCYNHTIEEYTIKPGTIVICDEAFPLEYEYEDMSFADCPYSKIHIPDSVTKIGDMAFSNCHSLTEIHIPDSVTSIGERAFSGCSSLEEIHIPNSVTRIGDWAFFGCESLTEIHIPDSVTSIGDFAFLDCNSLIEISIPDSVTEIGKLAFSDCSSLTSIFVDKKNKYYDSRNHCNAVIVTESNKLVVGCASTIIPDSVTRIGDWAFSGCSSLTEIHIPDSVTRIGDGAFSDCRSLTEIHIPDSVTSIGERAFSRCRSLEEIHISDSVTHISDYAFSDCRSLTEIHIPDSVTKIGKLAFSDCRSLTEIHIPDSVTTIGDGIFSGCSSLSQIVIPTGSRNKFEEMIPDYKDKFVEV